MDGRKKPGWYRVVKLSFHPTSLEHHPLDSAGCHSDSSEDKDFLPGLVSSKAQLA